VESEDSASVEIPEVVEVAEVVVVVAFVIGGVVIAGVV